MLAFACEGEGEVSAAAVQVVVYGALEVSYTWGAGLVGAEGEGGFRGVFWSGGGVVRIYRRKAMAIGGCGEGGEGGGRIVLDCLGVGAEGGIGEEGAGEAVVYSWLEHLGD